MLLPLEKSGRKEGTGWGNEQVFGAAGPGAPSRGFRTKSRVTVPWGVTLLALGMQVQIHYEFVVALPRRFDRKFQLPFVNEFSSRKPD